MRYLAAKHGAGTLEPANPHERARASQWMDWMLTVCAPAIHPLFWGMIRTPPEKQDHAKIAEARDKTAAALRMLDTQLGKTKFAAGDTFSMGDIPVGLITYRFRGRPARRAEAEGRRPIRSTIRRASTSRSRSTARASGRKRSTT